MGRFLSPDSVVPGAATGSLDGVALKALTVSFQEPALLARLNAENRGGDRDLYRGGPLNPQALNRYSYVLNNPVNATDPTGHYIELNYAQAKHALITLQSLKTTWKNYLRGAAELNNVADAMITVFNDIAPFVAGGVKLLDILSCASCVADIYETLDWMYDEINTFLDTTKEDSSATITFGYQKTPVYPPLGKDVWYYDYYLVSSTEHSTNVLYSHNRFLYGSRQTYDPLVNIIGYIKPVANTHGGPQ